MQQQFTPMTTANLLQNVAMLALMFFGSRAHMSGDAMGQWASLIGIVTTLVTNHITVVANADGSQPPQPNVRPTVTNGLAATQ